MPLGGFLRLMIEVLGAIGAAHARGIVHRDLKPDNVLVTPAGHARVLDFGIAKLAPDLAKRSGPTRSGMLLGTPTYMAPEQAVGKPIDARSDLYSIGVMLFEGATGTVPFDAPVLYELLRRHIEEPPPSPRTHRPEIPLELEAVILRALEKEPDRRHASAAEMADALRAVLDRLPASARGDLAATATATAFAATQRVSPSPAPVPATRISDSKPRQGTTAVDVQAAVSTERTARSRSSWIVVAIAIATAALGFAAATWWMGSRGRVTTASIGDTTNTTDTASAGNTTNTANAVVAVDAAPIATSPSPAPAPAAPTLPPASPKAPPPKPTAEPRAPKPEARSRPPVATAAPADAGPAAAPAAPPGVYPKVFQLEVPSPTAFDAAGYYPKALAAARRISDDAQLTFYYVDKAKPSGLSDLTTGGSAVFAFRSKARSSDPPARCLVHITVVAHTIQVVEGSSDECSETIIGAPRCTPAEIWKRGQTDGAPEKGVGNVMLLWWQGKKVWHFRTKDFFKTYDDDC